MPQLPHVAVLGPDLAGATALVTLVDAGLDATGVGGRLTRPAAELLAAYALTDRWIFPAGTTEPDDVTGGLMGGGGPPAGAGPGAGADPAVGADATVGGDPAVGGDPVLTVTRAGSGTGPGRGFAISVGGRPAGRWDAVVVTARDLAAAAGVLAAAPWYGGVFHPVADGVFLLGVPDSGQVVRPDGERDLAVTKAQAGWVGEYLRGRYRLPADQAMLDHPGLRRTGLRRGAAGYLRALDRELRAGRSRAAAAGYPLPLPAAEPAAPAAH
ncbi:hypothetical protein I6A60_17705 [Frankia sp. AgB1.9]|uniref:hypothetical protein n=1 Tax=unclassified Frankia TaxID=2632575 RepID=UPI001933C061|nr:MULTISPECIES: hypothetical protein [unclassified Frankia]MBL7492687.1 hypothetical protein [Frankia sp. AgW1.1]MBL7549697.1 hypothetical protein [Frankia sp. AgB1.9]MBL7623154.1 hypothetical protein [Frankia sp. AgB1.8]